MSSNNYSDNQSYSNEEEGPIKVVMDIGSGEMKIGFGGDDSPRATFPNITGRVKEGMNAIIGSNDDDRVYIGHEAVENTNFLTLTPTVIEGKIHDFDGWEKTVRHSLEVELRVDVNDFENTHVLLTEAPLNPKDNRMKMYERMFGSFGVGACQVQVQAILALYSSGRVTGMVLDVGDGVAHTVPTYKGYAKEAAVSSTLLAGRMVSKELVKALGKYNDLKFNPDNAIPQVREIKERHCYSALNFEEEMKELKDDKNKHVRYELANHKEIMLAEAMIAPVEVLWAPKKFGVERESVGDIILNSINETDWKDQQLMYENTVLSGGTTTIRRFEERCLQEMENRIDSAKDHVKISASEDRKIAVFNGGSILVELPTFQESWITQKEFEEDPNVVWKKSLFGEKE